MTANDDLHHLAAAYALDALDPAERRAFEAHYPSCAICCDEVDDYRATAARLAGATPAAPPADLRARVLAEIASTRQLSPHTAPVVDLASRRRRVAVAVAGAAAAALLLVVGVVVVGGDDTPGLIDAPDTVVAALGGDVEGTVSVLWSADREVVTVVASDLAPVGDDETYALWAIDDAGVPVPSVLFAPGPDGDVVVTGMLEGTPAGWGVTVEPAGGSPAPTGDIILTGA